MLRFRSNGKLLISGEYLVLVGAKALAVPTKFGQTLDIEQYDTTPPNQLKWTSYDNQGVTWFDASFDLSDFSVLQSSDDEIARRLQLMLRACRDLESSFLQNSNGLEAKSHLEFPRNWGLGSSSTLTNNLAQWAQVDALDLHFSFSTGSGYDVAAASHDTPIIYKLVNGVPEVLETGFNPSFKDKLHFIHLNKKQDSAIAVKAFLSNLDPKDTNRHCNSIGLATEAIRRSIKLQSFCFALEEHEKQLGELLQTPTIKEQLFADYPNTIKSLGAWGGDFILAVGTDEDMSYFRKKGYNTVVPYNDMVINNSHQ